MEKYEYKVENFKDYGDSTPDEFEVHLDTLGKQGWRLVAIDEGKYIFIRVLEQVVSSPYRTDDRY